MSKAPIWDKTEFAKVEPHKNFISLFEGKGVKTCSSRTGVTNPNPKGGARGKIKGWSKSSRRRLRLALLKYTGKEGTKPYGLTLTIPGVPALCPIESKKVFENFCREVERRGVGLIWRVEIQERGALHWHAVAWAPELIPFKPRSKKDKMYAPTHPVLYMLWMDALSKAPPVEPSSEPSTGIFAALDALKYQGARNKVPGADKHAFDCQDGSGSKKAWLRYLQDHATKLKQGQIPEDIGRHWGVVGKNHLVNLLPDEIVELTENQFKAVIRQMQRLATPQLKCPKAPFGKKLGYTLRRGSKGVSVWFSTTDTVRRMVEWSIREFPGKEREQS